jgi:dUTP pyrophosphatase
MNKLIISYSVMKVKYAHQEQYPIGYQSDGAAGIDLRAVELHFNYNPENRTFGVIKIPPVTPRSVKTGVSVEIPKGYFGLLCLRSSMGKKSLRLLNTVGVIDSDYRGEIVLQVVNDGDNVVEIERFDRIAQLVLIPVIQPTLEFVEELSETERGSGGFGSTGSK